METVERPWWLPPSLMEPYEAFSARDSSDIGRTSREWATLALDLIQRCPAFLMHRFLFVRSPKGGVVPFNDHTPGQRQLYTAVAKARAQRKPIRAIVLKSRRQGVTTLIQALAYWRAAFFEYTNGLVASHEDRACTTAFGMFKTFHERLPDVLRTPTTSMSTKGAVFKNGSEMHHRTTARGGGAAVEVMGKGRGQLFHFLHGNEAAFWSDPHDFWSGAAQGIEEYPETYAFLESTANGFGWFFEQWDEASAGWEFRLHESTGRMRWTCLDPEKSRSDMTPIFLSWLEEPRYSKPFVNDAALARFMRENNPEEKRLEADLHATPEQLHWRRSKLWSSLFKGDTKKFRQEYPATPEEAFISTGSKVFDGEILMTRLNVVRSFPPGRRVDLEVQGKTVTAHNRTDGPVQIFKDPLPDASYILAGDASYGHASGDNAALQVLRADNWEQVACCVGPMPPDRAGLLAVRLGRLYHGDEDEALAIVEIDGPGLTLQTTMQDLGYGNFFCRIDLEDVDGTPKREFGFRTSTRSKQRLVDELAAAIRLSAEGSGIVLHDAETIRELMDWIVVRSPGGRQMFRPTSAQGHDDRIMSIGMALLAAIQGGFTRRVRQGQPDDEDDPTPPALAPAPGTVHPALVDIQTFPQGAHPALGGFGW